MDAALSVLVAELFDNHEVVEDSFRKFGRLFVDILHVLVLQKYLVEEQQVRGEL